MSDLYAARIESFGYDYGPPRPDLGAVIPVCYDTRVSVPENELPGELASSRAEHSADGRPVSDAVMALPGARELTETVVNKAMEQLGRGIRPFILVGDRAGMRVAPVIAGQAAAILWHRYGVDTAVSHRDMGRPLCAHEGSCTP